MRTEDLPEGTKLCEICRGRGSNFNRVSLEISRCNECEGQGFVVNWSHLKRFSWITGDKSPANDV